MEKDESAVGGAGLCRRVKNSCEGRPRSKSVLVDELVFVFNGEEMERPRSVELENSGWTIFIGLGNFSLRCIIEPFLGGTAIDV